jgi:hypothetical protein
MRLDRDYRAWLERQRKRGFVDMRKDADFLRIDPMFDEPPSRASATASASMT